MEMIKFTELNTGGAELTVELTEAELAAVVNVGINTILEQHLAELGGQDD